MNTLNELARVGRDAFDVLRAAQAVSDCLAAGDTRSVAAFFEHLQPADVADVLDRMEPPAAQLALDVLPLDQRAEVFGYLPVALQAELVAAMRRQRLVELFGQMSSDERTDLYKMLDGEQQERILPALAQAERDDLLKLSSYAEGTVGAVMTSEYATLPAELSAREALEELRRVAPDKETIYDAYIIDAERRLVGVVTLRKLLVAAPNSKVRELMDDEPVYVGAHDPRKRAAELVARYDLRALPVINGGGALVGIVTADDAMDVAEQETTLSFQKTGSVSALPVSIRDAGIWLLFQKRVFWLVVLVFGNIFSGAGIAYFEDTIAAHIALVFFLPLLIDSGGNAGSQSATLMVRALATGDVMLRDWGRMLGREVGVALLLGVAMALAVSVLGILRGGPQIAMVVSLTMVTVVLVGSLIGMSLPFILTKLKLDPATASAPLITSIADGAGVLIYFAIATALLPGLAELAAAEDAAQAAMLAVEPLLGTG